uniref:Uncharacterized protein n=1 Tax=Cyprinus carpio TaxID=7962 RepID=A0A8C2BC18_CYPCA
EFKKTIKLIVLCVLSLKRCHSVQDQFLVRLYFSVFLFLGTKSERIRSSLKHFTVGPAGELGANSSKNIFRFADGSFMLIPSKKCCGILLNIWLVLKYYSCGPYSCWGVNAAGNIAIRRVSVPLRIQDLVKYITENRSCFLLGALFMVEVDADGNVFGVDTQGNLVVGVTISNPPGSSWTNIGICLNGHKHVTFDLGRLYVICSDGSIRR